MASASSNSSFSDIEIESSSSDFVTFRDLPGVYEPHQSIVVPFELGENVVPDKQDWVGIFSEDWKSLWQYHSFQWAPLHPSNCCKPRERHVTFPSTTFLEDLQHSYQFLYVSRGNNVVGTSTKFRICDWKPEEDCSFIDIVDDDYCFDWPDKSTNDSSVRCSVSDFGKASTCSSDIAVDFEILSNTTDFPNTVAVDQPPTNQKQEEKQRRVTVDHESLAKEFTSDSLLKMLAFCRCANLGDKMEYADNRLRLRTLPFPAGGEQDEEAETQSNLVWLRNLPFITNELDDAQNTEERVDVLRFMEELPFRAENESEAELERAVVPYVPLFDVSRIRSLKQIAGEKVTENRCMVAARLAIEYPTKLAIEAPPRVHGLDVRSLSAPKCPGCNAWRNLTTVYMKKHHEAAKQVSGLSDEITLLRETLQEKVAEIKSTECQLFTVTKQALEYPSQVSMVTPPINTVVAWPTLPVQKCPGCTISGTITAAFMRKHSDAMDQVTEMNQELAQLRAKLSQGYIESEAKVVSRNASSSTDALYVIRKRTQVKEKRKTKRIQTLKATTRRLENKLRFAQKQRYTATSERDSLQTELSEVNSELEGKKRDTRALERQLCDVAIKLKMMGLSLTVDQDDNTRIVDENENDAENVGWKTKADRATARLNSRLTQQEKILGRMEEHLDAKDATLKEYQTKMDALKLRVKSEKENAANQKSEISKLTVRLTSALERLRVRDSDRVAWKQTKRTEENKAPKRKLPLDQSSLQSIQAPKLRLRKKIRECPTCGLEFSPSADFRLIQEHVEFHVIYEKAR